MVLDLLDVNDLQAATPIISRTANSIACIPVMNGEERFTVDWTRTAAERCLMAIPAKAVGWNHGS
jgi:hypothetical protein